MQGISRMGKFLDSILYNLGFFARVVKGVGSFVKRGQAAYKILIMQILYTFVEALGIASFLAIGIGAAVTIIGIPFLASLSQERLIYSLLITIIILRSYIWN